MLMIDGESPSTYLREAAYAQERAKDSPPPPAPLPTYVNQTVSTAEKAQLGAADGTNTSVQAIADGAQATLALAAELRQTYRTNPANRQATEAAARRIADHFGDSQTVQRWTNAAVHMVLTETPAERATNVQAVEVDQAGATYKNLTARQLDGGHVSAAQVAAAGQQYDAAQRRLVSNVGAELRGESTKLAAQYKDPYRIVSETEVLDPGRAGGLGMTSLQVNRQLRNPSYEAHKVAYAAGVVAAEHVTDPEIDAALQAVQIVRTVSAASGKGTDAQMKALAGALPAGTDITVESLVLSDPAVKNVPGDYVKYAVAKVAAAYNSGGSVAGADALQGVVTQIGNYADSAQLAARIIDGSMATVHSIVANVPPPRTQVVYPPPAEIRFVPPLLPNDQQTIAVANDLSQAVEVAAAGGTASRGQYDTPEITAAVNGVAQQIATHPGADLALGLTSAVGQGYATLALATASQLAPSQRGVMLDAINTGLGQFQTYLNTATASVATTLEPVIGQANFSPVLTDTQFENGEKSMFQQFPALRSSVAAGLSRLQDLGYRVIRTDDAVSFYGKSLDSSSRYSTIEKSVKQVMSSANGVADVLISPAAHARIVDQALREELPAELRNGGTPNDFINAPGQIADFTEFMAESLGGAGASGAGAGQVPTALLVTVNAGTDAAEAVPLRFARIGQEALGPFVWAGGATAGALLTDYVFHNNHPSGPGPELRRAVLLTVIGGYATIHGSQAVLATLRQLAPTVSKGYYKVAGLFSANAAQEAQALAKTNFSLKVNGVLDTVSRYTVEATKPLIQAFAIAQGLATVNDLVNLAYDPHLSSYPAGTEQRVTNFVAHLGSLFNDSALLRLQLRGWAQQSLGKAVLDDPALKGSLQTGLRQAIEAAFGSKDRQTVNPDLLKEVTDLLLKNPDLKEAFPQLAKDAPETVVKPTGLKAALSTLADKLGLKTAFGRIAESTWRRQAQVAPASSEVTPASSEADPALEAFFDKVAAGVMKSLSTTGQRTLAAQWATASGSLTDAQLKSLPSVSRFLAQSKYLDSLDRFDPIKLSQSVIGRLFGPAGEEASNAALPDALGASVATAVAEDAATAGPSALSGVGLLVNLGYLGLTVGQDLNNQYDTMSLWKQYTKAFVSGAGVSQSLTEPLAVHHFTNGESAADGLISTYELLGGKPGALVDDKQDGFAGWVDEMNANTLRLALAGLDPAKNVTQLPAQASDDYWTLPPDPNMEAQRQYNQNLVEINGRWEDTALNMYYAGGGQWKSVSTVGETGQPQVYDTLSHTLQNPICGATRFNYDCPTTMYESTVQAPLSRAGLLTWMVSYGVPSVPTEPVPQPPLLPDASPESNIYFGTGTSAQRAAS
jgi:hypothetical protein